MSPDDAAAGGGAAAQIAPIAITLVLIGMNGFFVAAELALVRVRKTRMQELARAGGRRARVVRALLDDLNRCLSATQVGITIASLGLGWIGEPAVARLFAPLFVRFGASVATATGVSFAVAFAAISCFHIILGELVPKSMVLHDAEHAALIVAYPMRVFFALFWPLTLALDWASSLVVRAMGFEPRSESDHHLSVGEIKLVVEASGRSGELEPAETRLLDNALTFSERLVREIMVPRPDMVCLFADRPFDENFEIVRASQHTRYPLAVGDREHVVGMIHVRDLVRAERAAREPGAEMPSLETLKRPILFVPAVATIDRVLRLFQRGQSHLAIVVDEYGGVEGLVTLEDVLEELVGDIRDEFDEKVDRTVEPGASGELLVDAGLSLADVARGFRFEPAQATVDTIGGYVLQLLGRLPKTGDAVQLGRYRVEVAEMDGLRVTRLLFRPPADGKKSSASGVQRVIRDEATPDDRL